MSGCLLSRYGLSSVGLRAVSYIRCEARAPMRHFRKLTLPAMPHFKESLNEPLKQRVSFNFEFPFENSRIYVCAARNFALVPHRVAEKKFSPTRSLRSSRTDAAFSKVDTSCNAALIRTIASSRSHKKHGIIRSDFQNSTFDLIYFIVLSTA